MQIAVIGAGIVGVTTAFELAWDGHAVTVFERRPSVAAETSFANAGVITTGCVAPWAAPGLPTTGRHGPFTGGAGVSFGPGALGASRWLWRALRSGRKAVHAANRAAVVSLAQFSRARMDELATTGQLAFEQAPGLLVLLRTSRDLARARKATTVLSELGIRHEVVDPARCHELEPGLSRETPLNGAVHLPHDGVGNCRQFAHLLKAQAQSLGARFQFDAEVLGIAPGSPPAVDWRTAGSAGTPSTDTFDAVVVCAGVSGARLLAPLGVRLPLLPVHGYSLTAPIRQLEAGPDIGPRSGVVDERHRIAITRLGQRVRVSGGSEIGGRDGHLADGALRALYRTLQAWFPGAAELARVQHWKGARPMLPDGAPVLGPSGSAGVWLNLGHGASGWALACGSARVLADQIGGRAAAIDVARLGIERLR